jgi:hypothetical protein
MAEVSVNIGANTSQATAAVEELNSAIAQTGAETKKTEAASEDLSKSLERQEARIKVIDGAINLLGGSVELAAGAVVGLGLASEEGAKEFEAAALGAIAFADGAKRTFDGVKSLTEGLKAYGGIAGAARKAQAALNAVILANPYIAAGVAIAALTAAVVIYVNSLDDAADAERKLNAERAKNLQFDADYGDLQVRIARARGDDAVAIKKQEIATRELRIAQLEASIEAEQDGKKRIELLKERRKLTQDQKVAVVELASEEKKAAEQVKKDEEAAAEKRKQAREKRKADEAKAAQERFDALNAENKRREDALKTHEDNVTRIAKEAREQRLADAKFLADAEAEDDEAAFQKVLDDLEKRKQAGIQAAKDAADVQQALQDSRIAFLDNTAAAVGALANLFGQGTAAFKAAALAEIAISTATGFINALDIAQKSAKATGPAAAFAFPIFYASQIAAVLGAVAAAKNVLSTTPGGGGGIPTSSPRASSPSFAGLGATPLGGGFVDTGAPVVTPSEPLRAYVVTGDVVNGIQASGQIQRRRTLGPG